MPQLALFMSRYMLELGRYVPIVPVVTKADTMTIAEAAKYRRGEAFSPPGPPSMAHGLCLRAQDLAGLL